LTRRRILSFAASLLLVGAGWSRAQSPEEVSAARLMDDLMWNRGPIGGPFALSIRQARRAQTRISAANYC